MMRIVVIESPFRAYDEFDLQRNLAYARALVEHVMLRGDCPVASHLLITQSLDDRILEHRQKGIAAGLALLRVADVHAFGVDLGVSAGMADAMRVAQIGRVPVEEISLPEWKHVMTHLSPEGIWDVEPLKALVDRYQPKWHAHEAT